MESPSHCVNIFLGWIASFLKMNVYDLPMSINPDSTQRIGESIVKEIVLSLCTGIHCEHVVDIPLLSITCEYFVKRNLMSVGKFIMFNSSWMPNLLIKPKSCKTERSDRMQPHTNVQLPGVTDPNTSGLLELPFEWLRFSTGADTYDTERSPKIPIPLQLRVG